MTAPAAGDGDLRAQLAEALHAAFEWQYDQCSHGTYSGGPSHGQPYAMCDLFAGRLIGRVSRHADQRAAEVLRNLRTALSNDEDAPTDAALEGLDFTLRVLAAGAARLDPQHTDKETDR